MVGELSGATVRDESGQVGRILRWQLPEVTIGWEDGNLLPREERFERTNPRLRNQIEVMTLDAGWTPLASFMNEDGVPTSANSTIAQLRSLISEADELTEKGKAHWPYKRKSHLGKGPRDGENDQTDGWDCTCANYRCGCKGTGDNAGRNRTVKINKGYKRTYNREYKSWCRKNPEKCYHG